MVQYVKMTSGESSNQELYALFKYAKISKHIKLIRLRWADQR